MPTSRIHVERLPPSALVALHFVLSLGRELATQPWPRPEPAAEPTPIAPDEWNDGESGPRLALSLAERVTAPSLPALDKEARIREGVARMLREQDDALGLNQPEVAGVARMASEAARETGAAHGSKVVFEIALAANGAPLSVTLDVDSRRNRAWLSASDALFARLQAAPVRMGPAAARAGAIVEVEVEVLHVFPHGTDWQFKLTDCSDVPKIEHVDEHGRPLQPTFAFGLRFDIGSWGADKQLVVRTRAERRLPDFENERGLDDR